MPEPVTTPQQTPPTPPVEVVPEHNPYAPYGLDAQGNPLPQAKPTPPNSLDTKVAQLETKLATAEKALEGQTSMAKKMEVIDRIVKAVSGKGDETPGGEYREIFEDLKKVVPPGLRKAFELLEQNPNALDQLTGSLQSLHADRLISLNSQAHERVVELAQKAGFKGKDSAEMNKMVFPFERAITEVISANPKLMQSFVNGDMDVVEEVFNSLVAPHVGQRLREKQARMRTNTPAVKTPPFGKAAPGETQDNTPQKPDIRTPKGRAEFHKQATARFFNKIAAREEE